MRSPSEVYRRIEFDARISGSDPKALVLLCLEQFDGAMGLAITAAQGGDNLGKSKGLTRALTALTALIMGVDTTAPLGPVLLQFYEAARKRLLMLVTVFDHGIATALRADLADIHQSLAASMTPGGQMVQSG